MRGRTTILAVVAPLIIAACGGSGHRQSTEPTPTTPVPTTPVPSTVDVVHAAPGQIVSDATRAINAVRSLRVTGTVTDNNSTIKLDLHLVNGTGATGSMSENGLGFKLISVGGSAYINGSAGFWRQFGGSAAVKLLQGKWLRAPAGSGQFSSFASLTNVHELLSGILAGHGALTKGSRSTVDGQPVIALQDHSNPGRPGILYIATSGQPFPIRLTGSAPAGQAQLDFSAFNEPVTVKAPASSVDISKLKNSG
jgi:hypothetical protein